MSYIPQSINYTETYFIHNPLTRVTGTPKYEDLKTLKEELCENAQQVVSDLGGGANGHLGLVLSPAEYALVNPTPYLRPTLPVLQIPGNASQTQIMRLEMAHNNRMREYREVIDVEKALSKQVQRAIDAPYIKPLKNQQTGALNVVIPDLLRILFKKYGKLDHERVKDKERDVYAMTYNLHDPLTLIYNPIDDLNKMGAAAGLPYTNEQIVGIAHKIIKHSGYFTRGLETWEVHPEEYKTWANFKTHFDDARDTLETVGGFRLNINKYEQANANYIQQIYEDIANVKSEVLATLHLMEEKHSISDRTPSLTSSTVDEKSNAASDNSSLSSTESVHLQTLQIMKEMKAHMKKQADEIRALKKRPLINDGPNPPANAAKGNIDKRVTFQRDNISQYCWTHGACNHESSKCRRRRKNHQNDATFEDKKGGSTLFCEPSNE